MKKILPAAIALISLLVLLYIPALKTTEVSYSETTKDKYTSSPTPQSAHLKTYKNKDYNLLIEYPNISLNPQNVIIECGNFISEDQAIALDNLAWIQVVEWDRSVGEYLRHQGALNLYNVSAIMDSGAKQALSLNSLKTEWKNEGSAPLSNVSSIYLKDGRLFLIAKSDELVNEGCINPKILNNPPHEINRIWEIEDHLRFY